MQREIKFRAWNSKKPEMIYIGDLTDANWDSKFIFKHYAIMQYTGLKDKNGKEIYEGDVVRYNTGEMWFVEWDAKQAGFIYRNRQVLDKAGRKKPSGIGYGQLPGSHEVEIIGNIYENPELLTKEGA